MAAVRGRRRQAIAGELLLRRPLICARDGLLVLVGLSVWAAEPWLAAGEELPRPPLRACARAEVEGGCTGKS
jgi:hypothetical protein